MRKQFMTVAFLAFLSSTALAGEADVIAATATRTGDGTWRFSATIKHADEGWKHYADAFEVLTTDGKVLGVRTLFHPHVNEQPFTRSLGGVKIPANIKKVIIRAHDSVHGYGGRQFELTLGD